MNSVWSDNAGLPRFETLNGDAVTDVLIIGGGIAGILCACELRKKGVDFLLAEGGRICSGVTKNTTAKITAQHGLIYDKLLKSGGARTAKMYYNANRDAVAAYRKLCENIDCDFEDKPSYVYSLSDRAKLEREAEALRVIGVKTKLVRTDELPFKTVGAIRLDNQAQFNPLKFISAAAKDLNIYENTFVRELSEHTAVTDKGRIKAKKIIVTSHFPFDNKHGMYFLKMYQRRSYVIALENARTLNGMYIDEAQDGMSFRSCDNLLLVGGGGHRTGKSGGGWHALREFAKQYYPDSTEKYFWATQDCMTLDGVPYIGRYSKNTPDLFVASGFNKWGMTSSMAAAKILADIAVGAENPYAEAFSPSRNMLKPQLLYNGIEAAANLLSISGKRCPHLGCALKWNKAERSWDCPCHGSRFDEYGMVLDNPANGNIIPQKSNLRKQF